MRDLREMTSKELKEIAKELHVKNWWNLRKEELIREIEAIECENEEELEDEEFAEEEVEEIMARVACGETIDSAMQAIIMRHEDEEEYEDEEDTVEAPISTIEETSEEPKENNKPKTKKPNLKLTELTYKGETKSIRAWAEEINMPWPTLYDRVNRNGWSVEDAIEIPLGQRRPR